MSITKYLFLPKEITEFEHNYLSKLNRIALYFFLVHIPVFMLVAWAAGTGMIMALGLSIAVLIGPTIAQFTMKSERVKSMVYGFTAMCMGAILVHFGQGLVQIEMHFYFFALLAMLCAYANPAVNIVAAVTVALHHLIFYFLLPASVFNYEAPIWVVLVHALFVVLETVATCYISRRFFDDVIGLEKIVQARTKEINLMLNNIGQGFMTVTLDGIMSKERSSVVSTWFGNSDENMTFADYIRSTDSSVADWFEIGMDTLREDMLPTEVAMDQLPKRIVVGTTILELSYKPINNEEEKLEKVLIIISDITSQIEREAAEKQQKQLMDIFGHIMRDKLGFLEFLTEADSMIDAVVEHKYENLPHLKRIIHTIKGNAGLFGMTSVSTLCHQLEDEIVSEGTAPTEQSLTILQEEWNRVREKLDTLLGERMVKNIEIADADYEMVLRALLNREEPAQIAKMVQSWKLETAQHRLDFIKQQTEGLAQRMGKTGVDIFVKPNNIRLESEHWAPFWSSFTHILRNALDHGIESEEERNKAEKQGKGAIRIETNVQDGEFIISVQDNGRGIDWNAVSARASKANLPHENQEDLMNALFQDGVSTKDVVTQFSGRGVGMGAVKAECLKRGGSIKLNSQDGKGTMILFRFPMSAYVYNSENGSSEKAA